MYTERIGTQTHNDRVLYCHSKIAALLKYLICYTGDWGSRLDTFDNIETEKKLSYCQIASLLLNSHQSYIIEDQILNLICLKLIEGCPVKPKENENITFRMKGGMRMAGRMA